jgi:para-nitrobenzyl esterase
MTADPAFAIDPDLIVGTPGGPVRGARERGLRIWRSIPYAAPPVGPLRFRPPQPVTRWDGVLDCLVHRSRAWQSQSIPNPLVPSLPDPPCDEDCLTLSVTVPDAPTPTGGWPVLIWVHGGGYVVGSGAGGAVGDGDELARHGMIVVTINYRLGAIGFLDLSSFQGADEAGGLADSGSNGLLDQILAVQWVRAAIGQFGGDPTRITLYGVSAGAKSVVNLLAAPGLRGQIRSAISASGGGDHIASPAQSRAAALMFLGRLGLDESTAMKVLEVPPEQIIEAQESIAGGIRALWLWRPVLGTSPVPVMPIEAIAAGAARGVALVAGNNGREGVLFQLSEPTSAQQAPRVLGDLFGLDASGRILDGYRAARPGIDERDACMAAMGDERYGIPTVRLADAQSTHGPVWRYRFDKRYPGMAAALDGGHGMDLLPIWGPRPANHGELTDLVNQMQRLWANLALTGDPNGDTANGDTANGGSWPRYSAARETLMLDQHPHVENDPRGQERMLWGDKPWPSGTWWALR